MKRNLTLAALVLALCLVLNCTSAESAESSARATWTAPGNDGDQGMCLLYVLGFAEDSTELVNNFDAYARDTIMATGPAGTAEAHVVENLGALTKYWFALKAVDGAGNWSNLSNVPSCTTKDKEPPADVADLAMEAL